MQSERMVQVLPWLIFICICLCGCVSASQEDNNVVRYSVAGDKILVCYYTRSKRLPPSSVPADLCTHIIYAFGVVSSSGISPSSSADIETYRTLVNLKSKNPALKVLISLQKDFSTVVGHGSSAMSSFSTHAVEFLKRYNFDGIDLDWEYPSSSQKEAFSQFIQTLSSSLRGSNFLLSMALPNAPVYFKRGFDVGTINRCVDFVTAMAYDFHMFIKDKDTTTGYHSPLNSPAGESQYLSSEGMIDFYLSSGIPAGKLLLGIPTYGRSWTLADPTKYGLHSPAIGKGGPAPYSGLRGLYVYGDVCVEKQQGAMAEQDQRNVAEYLHRGTTWVAFESLFTIKHKVDWVQQKSLAGVGVWALHSDDAQNVCKMGPLPLINAIRSGL